MRFGKRFENSSMYAKYEYTLAKEYIIPKFGEIGINLDEKAVLDAGCGWGGCSAAFSKIGAQCTGVDISKQHIIDAKKFSQEKKAKAKFFKDDVCNLKAKGKFDIIILRDVLEYVNDPLKALISLKSRMADGGVLYVTFAPWYSPYGGHQHHPESIARFMPYFHLLPKFIFFGILKNKKGLMSKDKGFLEEIRRIRSNKLSVSSFERMLKKADLKIFRRNLYLIRPAFKIRMGLPTINLGILSDIPILNEPLTTGVEYFLKK